MQSTGQTSMHFSSFVQLSTITNAMNHFSSDEFVKFPIPHRRVAPDRPIRIATSLTRAKSMCNSCAKCRMLLVACTQGKSNADLASWIERPIVGGKMPTSDDLALRHYGPHIPAGSGVICETRVLPGAVIPAKAGI
jgi:hypothetical protein